MVENGIHRDTITIHIEIQILSYQIFSFILSALNKNLLAFFFITKKKIKTLIEIEIEKIILFSCIGFPENC